MTPLSPGESTTNALGEFKVAVIFLSQWSLSVSFSSAMVAVSML